MNRSKSGASPSMDMDGFYIGCREMDENVEVMELIIE